MSIFLMIFLAPILLIAGTILLTLLVEFPIVYCTGITGDKRYIVAVNALTNVCLNLVVAAIFVISINDSEMTVLYRINLWTLFAEAILIPVAETILYLKISRESAVKVLLITYFANFLSFTIGLLAVGLITGKGFHGIGSFFRTLFGGGMYRW